MSDMFRLEHRAQGAHVAYVRQFGTANNRANGIAGNQRQRANVRIGDPSRGAAPERLASNKTGGGGITPGFRPDGAALWCPEVLIYDGSY